MAASLAQSAAVASTTAFRYFNENAIGPMDTTQDQHPWPAAWAACCLSLMMLVLQSWLAPVLCILALLGSFALLCLLRPMPALRHLGASPWVWAYPLLALASIAWSPLPEVSLRHGIQFLATVGCAILAARFLPPRGFISALLVAYLIVAMINIAFGRYGADDLSGDVAFQGTFRSKNQLAFMVSILMLAGLAVLLDRGQARIFRLLAIPALALVLPLLLMARSATSLVASALGVTLLLGGFFLSRLRPIQRALLLLAMVATLLPAASLLGNADELATLFITDTLGKSTTLTGRTTLWERAAVLIPDRPLLGVGFQSFWQPGNLEAEALWRYFHVRGGFHFHNVWVETTVQLGIVGAALLALTLASGILCCLAWSWRERSLPPAFFLAYLLMLTLRSFVEVDFAVQFSYSTLLFYAAVVFAIDHRGRAPRAVIAAPAPAPAPPAWRRSPYGGATPRSAARL
jgi:exopolysaccharide production protein ExoQ